MAVYRKHAWMTQEPPPGYIAGAGRGYGCVLALVSVCARLTAPFLPLSATGFTTRSDIGPMQAAAAAQQQQGAAVGVKKEQQPGDNLNETNYDEFAG